MAGRPDQAAGCLMWSRKAGASVAAVGREAGQMADAALHRMQQVGQRLQGLSPGRSPAAKRAPVAGRMQSEDGWQHAHAAAEGPASTTASSHDLRSAATIPLPGKGASLFLSAHVDAQASALVPAILVPALSWRTPGDAG